MSEIIIYTKNACPYCVAAKNLFQNLNLTYQEINVESNQELRQKLSAENNGYRTLPMIFINGKFMGGFDDVNKLHKNNELNKFL